MTIANILSIAGSDPSGGAGVQADLKTFAALGGYGMAVVTALTAQNTHGVQASAPVPARVVEAQLHSIFDDIHVDAVKIGMLPDADIVQVVADILGAYKPRFIVLDPVMVATSGDRLVTEDVVEAIKEHLIPMASLITPNIPEMEVLLRKAVLDVEVAAKDMEAMFGAPAVLLKGGHLKGDMSRDVLSFGGEIFAFEVPRIDTDNTHGTGCTLSSAIACGLGQGRVMVDAVRLAKDYITGAIAGADGLDVGGGHGPVWHGWRKT